MKIKTKRILISLGAITAITTPIVTTVLVLNEKKNKTENSEGEFHETLSTSALQEKRQNEWAEYLNDKSNNFDEAFITIATKVIDWSNPKPVVREKNISKCNYSKRF